MIGIFRAGNVGYSMLKSLYKGGGIARKKLGLSARGLKLEKSAKLVDKAMTGKHGGKRTFKVIKGGFGNQARYRGGQAIQGLAIKGKAAGKHLRKHHKAYGYGVTGAAAWDILDND
ncbi:MAG: hypothetical protein HN490_01680 [Gammaproteobacteria bacterium]|nr:hypothetical protein [Gammaproteobacteria bacterium]